MAAVVYGHSDDGKYEIVSLTPDKFEQAQEVMRKAFFIDENVGKAVELDKNPNAIKELEIVTARAMRDGCSLIAVEKETGIVAAASINKIQVGNSSEEHDYLVNFENTCKEPSAKSLVRFMHEADAACDLFKISNSDCLLELMFMATLKEHRKKGLAKKLTLASIDLARRLLNGENVKVSMDGSELDLEPVPKAVSAIYTSFVTQGIAAKMGFVRAFEVGFEKWSFDGRTYAERIGSGTPKATIDYFKL